MLDPKPFVERAAAQADAEVLAWARARQRMPGAAIASPGLLCAIAEGLVFVVDDVVGPGEVTLVERSEIQRAAVEHGALDAILRLDTSQGPIVYEDLRPEELRGLLAHGLERSSGDAGAPGAPGTPALEPSTGLPIGEGYPSAVGIGSTGQSAPSAVGIGTLTESAPSAVGIDALGQSTPSAVGIGPLGQSAPSAIASLYEPPAGHPSMIESAGGDRTNAPSHPSWIGQSTGIAAGESWVPGSLGTDPNAAVAGGALGEAIARNALRERLLRVLSDREAHAKALQRGLLSVMVDDLASRAAREAAAADERALGARLSETEEQRRQRAITLARERAAALRDAPEPGRRRSKKKRKRGAGGAAVDGTPDGQAASADDASAPDAAEAAATSAGSPATAPRHTAWGAAVWLIVLAGALPGLWIHPSVALLGAIVGFVVASSLAHRAEQRAKVRGAAPSGDHE